MKSGCSSMILIWNNSQGKRRHHKEWKIPIKASSNSRPYSLCFSCQGYSFGRMRSEGTTVNQQLRAVGKLISFLIKTICPVSYTHLDVYKRQTQYCTWRKRTDRLHCCAKKSHEEVVVQRACMRTLRTIQLLRFCLYIFYLKDFKYIKIMTNHKLWYTFKVW